MTFAPYTGRFPGTGASYLEDYLLPVPTITRMCFFSTHACSYIPKHDLGRAVKHQLYLKIVFDFQGLVMRETSVNTRSKGLSVAEGSSTFKEESSIGWRTHPSGESANGRIRLERVIYERVSVSLILINPNPGSWDNHGTQ